MASRRGAVRLSFGNIAHIAGWATVPAFMLGFGRDCYASRRFPIVVARNRREAADLCGGLNHRFARDPLSPRFGWLPASTFPRDERLHIEVSIREAQGGKLRGEAAEAIHSVAQQALTFAESLPKSRTGKKCYVFFRAFRGLQEPFPFDRFVVLPDDKVGAAIEAEGQRWAAENRERIIECLRKQSARITGGPPRRPKPRLSLDDLIRESDEAFSEAMKEPTLYFTSEDAAILQALAGKHPVLLTQEEIEGETRKGGRYVAVRTIRRRLPLLKQKGLVDQPEGKRSGWGLTEAGLKAAPPRT